MLLKAIIPVRLKHQNISRRTEFSFSNKLRTNGLAKIAAYPISEMTRAPQLSQRALLRRRSGDSIIDKIRSLEADQVKVQVRSEVRPKANNPMANPIHDELAMMSISIPNASLTDCQRDNHDNTALTSKTVCQNVLREG